MAESLLFLLLEIGKTGGLTLEIVGLNDLDPVGLPGVRLRFIAQHFLGKYDLSPCAVFFQNKGGHFPSASSAAGLLRYARSSLSHPGTRLPTVRSSPFRYSATSWKPLSLS